LIRKIILILPTQESRLETFLKALILGFESKESLNIISIYPSLKLSKNKLLSIIIFPIYLKRIMLFLGSHKCKNTFKKMIQLYINLEILTARKIDVIHYLFSNLAVGRENLAQIIGAKNSIGLRGYDITFYAINHPYTYSQLFWNSVDSIQTNSQDLYQWALKWGASLKTPITTINAAVDDSFIISVDKVNIKEKFNQIDLVFIGRLHWKKGLSMLMKIFVELLKCHNAKLVIIGDGPEREKIQFLISKFELRERVTITGKLEQIEILKHLDESDILLAPSIQEGCSNVVLEAQARGVYCIVSDAEGMNEVVEDQKTGVICEMWEDELWIKAILGYISLDQNSRKEIAEYSINRISRNFSRSKQIEKWENYFNELCSIS
jgi:colanic acid/amylovoran biosynthesis glycosyltransferase